MSVFQGRDDLGVICVNDWYVMDMQIRNLDGMGRDERIYRRVMEQYTNAAEKQIKTLMK